MPKNNEYPILTSDEFEIEYIQGVQRDCIVPGEGLITWDKTQVSINENPWVNYHSMGKVMSVDNGEGYVSAIANVVGSMITDGESYINLQTGEVKELNPQGHSITVAFNQYTNELRIEVSNGLAKSYGSLLYQKTIDDFFIDMANVNVFNTIKDVIYFNEQIMFARKIKQNIEGSRTRM